MKPAPFELARPASLPEAAATLARHAGGARLLAGGQSLGPMLNLRLVRPAMLVSIAHLPELGAVSESADAVTIGAGVTHAAIADGRTPDINGILARIAQGIAYRAVRNLGTIGGSLCHADPAADWLTTLTALGASILTWSEAGPARSAPRSRPPRSCRRCASRAPRRRRAGATTRPAASRASSPTPWRPY
jgi:carbon-monoxide dehydrogenase medium subunit